MQPRHRRAGDRFAPSASEHNAMVDAALAHQQTSGRQLSPGALPPLPPNMAYVRNDSGGDRARYDCVAITGGADLTANNDYARRYTPVLIGTTPNPATDLHALRVAVFDRPCAADKIAPAFIAGPCPARVNKAADDHGAVPNASHGFDAEPSGPHRVLWINAAMADPADAILLLNMGGGKLRQVITHLEADASGVRYKTQQVRVHGEEPESALQTLLTFQNCTV